MENEEEDVDRETEIARRMDARANANQQATIPAPGGMSFKVTRKKKKWIKLAIKKKSEKNKPYESSRQ